MWPRALAQLIELAPHFARLLPMADRFLQTKSTGDEAARSAMEALATDIKADLGQVNASYAGLYRQLNEQSNQIAAVAEDAQAAKSAAESAKSRMIHLEQRLSTATVLLSIGLISNVVLLALVIDLLLHR